MPDASFLQTSFLGGEWSPFMQGRMDHPKYGTAMNVCLNAYPVEEGSCVRRPGTAVSGTTRGGAKGRLFPFDFAENNPYTLEFTDGHLRFWTGPNLATGALLTVYALSAYDPCQVTTSTPHACATGDQVVFAAPTPAIAVAAAALLNRCFSVTVVDNNNFTIADAVTGVPLAGSTVALVAGLTVARVVDIATPYTSGLWSSIRVVPAQSSTQQFQAYIFHGATAPQLLTATTPPGATPFWQFTLAQAQFDDGPYIDPINGSVANIQAVTGSQTIYSLAQGQQSWEASTGYLTGAPAVYGGVLYIATSGGTGFGTNKGNIPAYTSNWMALTQQPPYPAYSGGSHSIGYICTYGGQTWTVTTAPGPPPGTTTHSPSSPDWGILTPTPTTVNLTGLLTLYFDFAPWVSTNVYGVGDVATYGGGNYTSLQPNNTGQEPDMAPAYWQAVNVGAAFSPAGAQQSDVGRLVRLLSEPQVWSATTPYTAGTVVTYSSGTANSYYTAQLDTTGNEPDTSLQQWLLAPNAGVWTWGIIVSVANPVVATVQLLGNPLAWNTPINKWQLGAWSSTTGYPTCGTFYQGRLYTGGWAVNRFDASVSNEPNNFSPTAPDGTVLDNSAISEVLNTADQNMIYWFMPDHLGIICGTLSGEFLIQASVLADPMTPTSITTNRVTKYGCANMLPVRTGISLVFVQKFGRRVMEFLADVFTGKFIAPNLSLVAKHLAKSGIAEITYQEELAPIIWARCNDGSLIGSTYRRVSAFTTEEPAFVGWHRHSLGSGRLVESLTNGPSLDGTLDSLMMITNDPATNVRHVEIMTTLFDEDAVLTDAWFLDDAVVPAAATINYTNTQVVPPWGISGAGEAVTRYTSVTLYGLTYLNGKTVTAWIGGVDCGDYLVANGQIVVPFGSDTAGLFTFGYLQAVAQSGLAFQHSVTDSSALGLTFPAVVGFTYTTQGQLLRPVGQQATGATNGPALGKTRRIHMFSALVHSTIGASFGTDFGSLRPANFASPSGIPLTNIEMASGVHWDEADDDYGFDGMLCWQVTRPYPCTVSALGGFIQTQDR